MIIKLHRMCEHPGCQITREYYPRDIERGKGLFCSAQCANEHRHDPTYVYNCEYCGLQFKTTDSSKRCCSIEHDALQLEKSTKPTQQNENS